MTRIATVAAYRSSLCAALVAGSNCGGRPLRGLSASPVGFKSKSNKGNLQIDGPGLSRKIDK